MRFWHLEGISILAKSG